MNPHRISFAQTLPILALLLSYLIIAVPATMTYIGLRHISGHGRGVTFHSHRYQFMVPRDHFFRESVLASAEVTSHYIQGLNVPGFMIEVPAERFTKVWPTEWVPPGLDFTQWRALILPLCCIPFWWSVGVGVDGMTTRRRLAWWTLLLGSILWASMAFFEVGLWLAAGAERRELVFPFWGLGLWLILLSAFPITWVRQWLARRRIRAILQARLFAELR